jgi:SH3-like domain-containing protein
LPLKLRLFLIGLGVAAGLLTALMQPAWALEYRSTGRAALLYDAPSTASGKVAIAGNGLPLEVVVDSGAWVKVRDPNGHLAWIEKSSLGGPKKVMVKADVSLIRQQPLFDADVVFRAARGVLLDITGESDTYGWLPVKHADGLAGWMPAYEAWGK